MTQASDAAPPRRIDVNSDVGELDDGGRTDESLLQVISSANVACGGHAGDEQSMRRICELAAERDVALGAQVSYPDREGFGRRRISIDPSELRSSIEEQVVTLRGIAKTASTDVVYLKPHGALYHVALDDGAIAQMLLDIAMDHQLALLTMSSGELHRRAQHHGVPVFHEAFIDRGYTPHGRLTPRDEPGAILDEATALQRLSEWTRRGLPDIDSLCVHSDTPDALRLARRSRETLESHGIRIEAFTGRHKGPAPA